MYGATKVKDGAVFTAGKVKDGAVIGVNAVGKGVSRAKSGVSILKDHIIDNEEGPLMLCPRCDGEGILEYINVYYILYILNYNGICIS